VAEHRRLDSCRRGLVHIRFRIQEESQRTDEMTDRLQRILQLRLAAARELVRERQRELAGLNPILLVKRGLAMMPQFMKRLERQMRVLNEQRRRHIQTTVTQLNNLSPLAILGRGYSILSKVQTGGIVRRARDVQTGEDLVAQLAQGRLRCTVKHVLSDPSV
jgi:exodeoxyribonuclease VII large subunit